MIQKGETGQRRKACAEWSSLGTAEASLLDFNFGIIHLFAFIMIDHMHLKPCCFQVSETGKEEVGAGRFPRLPSSTQGQGQPGSELQAPGRATSLPLLCRSRCSTVSTLSVRSSRVARRRRAARNPGQGAPAPPVSSSNPTHCEHPAPAHYPRVRAPTRAHPTNTTNKGGRGRGVTWVEQECALPRSWESRPGCKTTPTRRSPRTEGRPSSSLFRWGGSGS